MVGRDPRQGVIIPRYEPPEGHTPAGPDRRLDQRHLLGADGRRGYHAASGRDNPAQTGLYGLRLAVGGRP
jgi:hypothetical protein